MTDHSGRAPSANGNAPTSGLVRKVTLKIPIHIFIPIAALVAIAIATVLFAWLVLTLPSNQAPAVAMIMALNVLAAATYAARRSRVNVLTAVELGVLVLYPLLIAVVLANLGITQVRDEAEATAAAALAREAATTAAAPAAAAPVEVVADNLAFDTDELAVPADSDATVEFDNQDQAPHNLSIYENDTLKKSFFKGDTVELGESITYAVGELAPGAYYFQCDIHPSMNGRLTAE
jgi:plastocyanin